MVLTKQERQEKRQAEKKIRLEICQLMDKHCDTCTKVERNRNETNVICTTQCQVGIRMKELGDQLLQDVKSLSNGRMVQKKIEVELEPTKENYLLLKETVIGDEIIAQKMGISYATLYNRKLEWGLVKKMKKKEPDLVPVDPGPAPVVEKKEITVQELQEKLQAKEKQYKELFQQMQKQDQLLKEHEAKAEEYEDAVRYALEMQEQFDLLQDLFMARTDDKDKIINNLTGRICKLEAVLLDYLPKGRLEWFSEQMKS